jgi:hypothetical protein
VSQKNYLTLGVDLGTGPFLAVGRTPLRPPWRIVTLKKRKWENFVHESIFSQMEPQYDETRAFQVAREHAVEVRRACRDALETAATAQRHRVFQEFSLVQAEAAVNLLRLELCEERADHRLTATLRPPARPGRRHRERRERRRRPYQRRRRSWSGSDSRPSDDSDDDRRPPRLPSASSASVRSEATTVSIGDSRAETPESPWRWIPFDDQQAIDRGRCLEPSVRREAAVLSNAPVRGVTAGPPTNEATPKKEQ